MPSSPASTSAPRVPLATRLVWAAARVAAWFFYRVERLGPPVPVGPVLLVANHANGLLDPPLVVATSGRVPRFLAKSTLFAGAPYSFLIRWSGAIPVFRRQDAGADTARNTEMFTAVHAALARGDAVCLFPEGVSHSSGRLEELKTGAARMVLTAQAAGTEVAIVAIGLNFVEKGVFRSPALVAYGQPFSGRDLLVHGTPLDTGAVEALTARIAAHIRDVMVEASPTDDAALVARVERLYAHARDLPTSPADRLARGRLLAKGLDVLRARDPERLARLVGALRQYERRLARFRLSPDWLAWQPRWSDVVRFLVREVPRALVLVPLAVVSAIVFFVPYMLVDAVARHRSVSLDIQATVKVLGGVVVHGAWVLALAAIARWWNGWPAAIAVLLLCPLLGFAGVFAIEREAAVWNAARSWLTLRRTSTGAREHLRRRERELAALLDEAHAWVSQEPPGAERPPVRPA